MISKDRIYVAGHRGLVGSAIVRCLKKKEYNRIIERTHAELDLTDQSQVRSFFADEKPDCVFLAAAKVGGILANDTYPADFIYQNLSIEANIIHASYKAGVKQLMFLGSSCIYPKFAKQPMNEEELLSGKLEPTNEAYAIAKIAGIKMCAAYNKQYKTNFMSVMPTNLYGPGDNYDLQKSHVLPALIRKMHTAKVEQHSEVVIWGSGSPRREFLYSDDLADACVYLMENFHADKIGELVNIGVGQDLTIGELANIVKTIVGYQGDIVYDKEKPDGTPRKLLDVTKLNNLGWHPKISLQQGIELAYQDYLANIERYTHAAKN
jgi:GDP-L-fucose synthase